MQSVTGGKRKLLLALALGAMGACCDDCGCCCCPGDSGDTGLESEPPQETDTPDETEAPDESESPDDTSAPIDWCLDADGDGYGDPLDCVQSSEPIDGRVDNAGDCDDGDSSWHAWADWETPDVIVDDYAGDSSPGIWNYSRVGTNRGLLGDETLVSIGGGVARVEVASSGYAGLWTSLRNDIDDSETLDPDNLLGPHVYGRYQPTLDDVQLQVRGDGLLKLELIGTDGTELRTVDVASEHLTTVSLGLTSETLDDLGELKSFNWMLDGSGWLEVDWVRLAVSAPEESSLGAAEMVFLWSYAHLSQGWDPDYGLVRDRAAYPSRERDDIAATGLFALATAVAADRGFVEAEDAQDIVATISEKLRDHQRHSSGLFAHYYAGHERELNSEWSSVDSVILLLFTALAEQAAGLQHDRRHAVEMLEGILWEQFLDPDEDQLSHGYDAGGVLIESLWDHWSAEFLLMDMAFYTAEGRLLDPDVVGETFYGAGFNDELMALGTSMLEEDHWGVVWTDYRAEAAQTQQAYPSGTDLEGTGLFGLSACEAPEPWDCGDHCYVVNGVGGPTEPCRDGSQVHGYPFVCPHYAAMIGAEYPAAYEAVFATLVLEGLFTPLNNVEAVGVDPDGILQTNSTKVAWNLGMQTLGAARALYACEPDNDYPAPGALTSPWLEAYGAMME